MNLRSAVARLLALFRKRKLDRELEDEIFAHLELAERDAIAAGLLPEEALRAARRNFGGIEEMKEDHRDHRGVRWMENLLRDVRYGVGALVRDPGFAAVTIGLLALGIGANSAMFSIVDAVLLKPLPFPQPERMVRVWESTPMGHNGTTTLTFLDWKRQGDIFAALSVERLTKAAVATGGNPVRVSGKQVSADYFQVFGVKPQIGRTFAKGEDQPGAAPVVVLSHAFWRSHFAGDRGVLNDDLMLDGEPHKIIGVLPAGSFDRDEAVFWTPLIFAPDQMNRGQHWLTPIGRLRAGVTLAQARAKMNVLRATLNAVIYQKDWGFTVDPFAQMLVGDTLRRSIYLAFGAVLMVLLIACANVANLALAKGAGRRKEMALRAALGASRGRLIAQLLTESLVLCILGGVAGVALGAVLLHAAAPLVAASLPFTADIRMDLRVLGFAAAAVMAVLILSGLLPSVRTSFGKLSNALNQAARGSSGSSAAVRRTIVIGEVAASVVLICGAALLFKSLAKRQQVDAGIRIDHVITMSADLPSAAYPSPDSAARFYEAVVQRLLSVPGVEKASVAQGLPLQGVQWGENMILPGAKQPLLVRLKLVDPWYFGTLQIPLEAGRGIENRDRAGAPPVVVINQEVARQLAKTFGIANPVGRPVGIWVPGYGPIPEFLVNLQIVGVIRSERTAGLNAPPELVVIYPWPRRHSRTSNWWFAHGVPRQRQCLAFGKRCGSSILTYPWGT
ncbi:MAG: ABC transporter permease [Bryobacteraceae bacterium]